MTTKMSKDEEKKIVDASLAEIGRVREGYDAAREFVRSWERSMVRAAKMVRDEGYRKAAEKRDRAMGWDVKKVKPSPLEGKAEEMTKLLGAVPRDFLKSMDRLLGAPISEITGVEPGPAAGPPYAPATTDG
jgi:hypothetical protein